MSGQHGSDPIKGRSMKSAGQHPSRTVLLNGSCEKGCLGDYLHAMLVHVVNTILLDITRTLRFVGLYHWDLLSGMLEWSWVEIHGITKRD
ncbi:hypothetical protein HanPI659440_Chr14g0567041 [Helianthus annuus]|nr:hypothetical protein HanPI659440_Chr14g0567041 [Helianthus annuus]